MLKIRTLRILTSCVHHIDVDIASHSPERGGALLGPVGKSIVTHLIPDSQAVTTEVSYHPSLQLTELVQRMERSQPLEFKGVIHSHPGSLNFPSGSDEIALKEGLRINPQMSYFVAPIVTIQHNGQLRDHELSLGSAKISFYIAYRSHRDRITLGSIPVQKISEEEFTGVNNCNFQHPPMVRHRTALH